MYSFKTLSLSVILLCNTAHMFGTGDPQEQRGTQAPPQAAPREPLARNRNQSREYFAARELLMDDLRQQIQDPAAIDALVARLVVREHQPGQNNTL